MLRLDELLSETAETTVDFGGKELKVVFRPDALTAELEAEYHKRLAADAPIDAMAFMLSKIVVDWDVVDAEGKPIKPTYRFFRKLGVKVMARILRAVQDAAGMGDEREVVKNSGGGCSLTGR